MSEFLREAQWLVWVAIAIGLGLLELTSLDFVFGMLVLGSLSAAGVAALGFSLPWQIGTFSVVSALGLILGRPYLKRLVMRSAPEQPTNVDALAGRSALVLEVVTDRAGLVKLAGETWSARTAERGTALPAGIDVVVERIDGATAVVRAEGTGGGPAESGGDATGSGGDATGSGGARGGPAA